jgi:hypothetical protein
MGAAKVSHAASSSAGGASLSRSRIAAMPGSRASAETLDTPATATTITRRRNKYTLPSNTVAQRISYSPQIEGKITCLQRCEQSILLISQMLREPAITITMFLCVF